MKKLFFLLFLAFPISNSYASSASVNVEQNVNSSSTSNSSVNSYTNIRVETDGKVTNYSTNEPGKVEVKSENGETEIKVNGQIVTPSIAKEISSPTAKPTEAKKEIENKKRIKENNTKTA